MATQTEAIEKIASGNNVFVTGGAGRGKSYIIDQIYDVDTILTAPTGIAALNIGGATCHSVFALPIGLATRADETTIPFTMRELFEGGDIKRIVIDEVGNLRADVLDLIDKRLKLLAANTKPFGGIQVVTVGDLYQIEPVVSRRERLHFQKKYDTSFCFGAKCWNFDPVVLTKNYRQIKSNQSDILDSIRVQDENFLESINALINMTKRYESSQDTLNLCCYNKDADELNQAHFALLNAEEVSCTGVFQGDMEPKDVVVDQHLKLKIGAKVLIKVNNNKAGYCNGDRGTVKEFTSDREGNAAVGVELEGGKYVLVTKNKWEKFKYSSKGGSLEKKKSGSFTQFPLRLGYAISIHSCQGLTLDNVAINFGSGAFAHGMGYVSITRIRDLENLMFTKRQTPRQFLKNFVISEDVRRFYANGGK